jgi:hypothetical protein
MQVLLGLGNPVALAAAAIALLGAAAVAFHRVVSVLDAALTLRNRWHARCCGSRCASRSGRGRD